MNDIEEINGYKNSDSVMTSLQTQYEIITRVIQALDRTYGAFLHTSRGDPKFSSILDHADSKRTSLWEEQSRLSKAIRERFIQTDLKSALQVAVTRAERYIDTNMTNTA